MAKTATIDRDDLARHLDEHLAIGEVKDGCPNGLQVEGRASIGKVVLGVTASGALLEKAIERGADAVIVHHGLFWRGGGDLRIVRSMRRRLGVLIGNDVSLFAYHLPLDRHLELGNNAVLARLLGADAIEAAFPYEGVEIGVIGRLEQPVPAGEMFQRLAKATERDPLVVAGGPDEIRSFGVVTGAGQRLLEYAALAGLDLFVTGEANEQAAHIAREEGIHFASAGHHATERFGVQALGRYLTGTFGIEAEYVEIQNPI